MTPQQLEQVSGSILTSFVNLHFLEEASRTGVFKQKAKLNLKRTIADLIEIEKKYFNKIEQVDEEEIGDKLVSNQIDFIKFLLKNRYNDFTKLQEICVAYSLDKEAMSKLSDEILTKTKNQ